MTAAIEKMSKNNLFDIMLSQKDSYQQEAKKFVGFLQEKNLDFTEESVSSYISFLEEPQNGKRYSASTYNKHILAVKKRIRYLFEHSSDFLDVGKKLKLEQYLGSLKAKKVNAVSVPEHKILSYEEIDALLGHLNNTSDVPGGKTIALMVEFLSKCGCRVSEMLNVLISDTKVVKGKKHYEIRLLGKGRKERFNYFEKELIERVRKYFGGTDYLFEHGGRRKQYHRIYVTNQIKLAGRMFLGREIGAHTFRHSFITDMLSQGYTLKAVSRYVGHSSTSTTSNMYDQNILSMEDLRESVLRRGG